MLNLELKSDLYPMAEVMTIWRAIKFSWVCEKYSHFRLCRTHWHYRLTLRETTFE